MCGYSHTCKLSSGYYSRPINLSIYYCDIALQFTMDSAVKNEQQVKRETSANNYLLNSQITCTWKLSLSKCRELLLT